MTAASIFAIFAAGGVSVAVNHRLPPKDGDYILTHTGVDCVVVDRGFIPLMHVVFRQDNPHILLLEEADASAAEASPLFDRTSERGCTYD
jgi:acyl-CoA synthetase (AMP-forming)/AMP-acid ligase II